MPYYKLSRETDHQEWTISEEGEQAALRALSRTVGLNLFICKGMSEYILEQFDDTLTTQTAAPLPVSAGQPRFIAVVNPVLDEYDVILAQYPTENSGIVLTHTIAKTKEAALDIIDSRIDRYGIGADEIDMRVR
jgi:hypothetical protein